MMMMIKKYVFKKNRQLPWPNGDCPHASVSRQTGSSPYETRALRIVSDRLKEEAQGRAAIRKLMDSYARAAVNLYGIISRDAFVEIFNGQNAEKTTADGLYVLLLPLVLKNGWYGFYKEYLVHYSFFNDFGPVPYLLEQQGNKPRYIPEKDEFLKHALEGYEDDDGWWNVHKFMLESFGYSKKLGGCYLGLVGTTHALAAAVENTRNAAPYLMMPELRS